jgi:hypothetical protein
MATMSDSTGSDRNSGRHGDAKRPPPEHISGAIERVTFHGAESGFCVLRVKVRGQRDLVTVIGSAASVTAGEYIEAAALGQ